VENGHDPPATVQTNEGGPSRQLKAVAFDEFPLWLETISRVAESAGVQIVGSTTVAAEAAEIVREERPSLFIVGLNRAADKTEQADLLLAAAELEGVSSIVVSSETDPNFIDHCLSRGAIAYVLKTVRPDDLSSTIRQAVDRSVYLFGMPRRPRNSELDKLTPREREVLLLVAEGLSNREVAQRLWISTATVKFHLTKMYEKLGVANRTGAVRWAQRHGLLTSDSDATSRPQRQGTASAVRRPAKTTHPLSRS
jgi:DNA-binding NarL/FixJ family response regulator